LKRYRIQFYLDDDVAAWFENRKDKAGTIKEALTVCCRLEKLREILDGLARQTSVVPTLSKADIADKAVRLMNNIMRGFGDTE